MDLKTIQYLADKQARKAAKDKKTPYIPYDAAEVERYGDSPFPFPNIGTYRPKGWTMVDEWMVDSSGWGTEDEPALTIQGLKKKIIQNIEDGNSYGYAIVAEGQFQLIMGVFQKVEKKAKELDKQSKT